MRNICLINLSIFFIFFTNISYCQDSILQIPLDRKIGIHGHASFNLQRLKEVKNYLEYKYSLHENTEAFVIGRVYLNRYASSFSKRNLSKSDGEKYLKIYELQKFDTMQFFQSSYSPNFISALVSLDEKAKRFKIDANSNCNFDDDEEFTVDTSGIVQSYPSEDSFYIDTEVVVTCHKDSVKSNIVIPISIDPKYFDIKDTIGDNKYLQLYISPNIYYSGEFNSKGDTVHVILNTQNFDTFYDQYTDISLTYKAYNQTVKLSINPNSYFQIVNSKYKLHNYDPQKKILYLCYIGQDSIGNQPGNYLKISPGLENITNFTLLFFTGSWCKPCKPVLDSLFSLYHSNLNINIININHEVSTKEFDFYMDKYNIPWKVILDSTDQQWASQYRELYEIKGYPMLFFVNKDRKILKVTLGKDKCIELINEIKTNGLPRL